MRSDNMTHYTFKFNVLLFYSFFFVLLYFESTSIGIVKISQLWKIPVYIFVVYIVLTKYNKPKLKIPVYVFSSILLFMLIIINTSNPLDYIFNIPEAFNMLTLPLSLALFKIIKRQTNNDFLNAAIITYCSYLIIFNLPFILNLVPEINSVKQLGKYGLEEKTALTGVFYHINLSSKINLIATIVVLFNKSFFSKNLASKIIYLGLVVIGTYSVYLNYTRTGWFLFLFGILFVSTYKEKITKFVFKVIPVFLLFFTITIYWLSNNPAIVMRLIGETTYRTNENYDANQISSGRIEIWKHALANLNDKGLGSIILGQGVKNAMDMMKDSFGYYIPAHNRFIEILQYAGILGLLLFISILYQVYKQIRKVEVISGEHSTKLPMAIFIILLLSCIPSHGLPLYAEIILGALIVSNQPEKDKNNKL